MGMAKMAGAPVLLAGDIDRGGVFASLYGTVMLVTEEERAYIKGTVINKFRGDVEILRPGLKMLEDLIHIPTLGVVPYARLDIDDEDSLSERLTDSGDRGVHRDCGDPSAPHFQFHRFHPSKLHKRRPWCATSPAPNRRRTRIC